MSDIFKDLQDPTTPADPTITMSADAWQAIIDDIEPLLLPDEMTVERFRARAQLSKPTAERMLHKLESEGKLTSHPARDGNGRHVLAFCVVK